MRLFLATVLSIITICSASGQNEGSYLKLVDSANVLLKEKNYRGAIAINKEAIKINDESSTPYYNSACAAALMGKKKMAFEYLNQSIEHGLTDSIYIQLDTDLFSLHNEKEWKNIVAKVKENGKIYKSLAQVDKEINAFLKEGNSQKLWEYCSNKYRGSIDSIEFGKKIKFIKKLYEESMQDEIADSKTEHTFSILMETYTSHHLVIPHYVGRIKNSTIQLTTADELTVRIAKNKEKWELDSIGIENYYLNKGYNIEEYINRVFTYGSIYTMYWDRQLKNKEIAGKIVVNKEQLPFKEQRNMLRYIPLEHIKTISDTTTFHLIVINVEIPREKAMETGKQKKDNIIPDWFSNFKKSPTVTTKLVIVLFDNSNQILISSNDGFALYEIANGEKWNFPIQLIETMAKISME